MRAGPRSPGASTTAGHAASLDGSHAPESRRPLASSASFSAHLHLHALTSTTFYLAARLPPAAAAAARNTRPAPQQPHSTRTLRSAMGSDAAYGTSGGFGTRAIHAGQAPDPTTGAVIPPISLSTTFAQQAAGVHKVRLAAVGLGRCDLRAEHDRSPRFRTHTRMRG